MSELEDECSVFFRFGGSFDEGLQDARARAPCDVKPGNRVSWASAAVTAAFRPSNEAQEADVEAVQPVAHFCRSVVDVGLRPFARPVIFLAVEAGGGLPIRPGEIEAVFDAQPGCALFRRVDQKDAAQRPVRLTTE